VKPVGLEPGGEGVRECGSAGGMPSECGVSKQKMEDSRAQMTY
jgi:hypothetical protein